MIKIPKLSYYKWFYEFFPKFLTDFVNWNVENGQQRMHVLFSMLRKEINADLQRKFSAIDIEKTKF